MASSINYQNIKLGKKGCKALDVEQFKDENSWILEDEEIRNNKIEIKVTITEETNYHAYLCAINCGVSRRFFIANAIHESIKRIDADKALSEKQKRKNELKIKKHRLKIQADSQGTLL